MAKELYQVPWQLLEKVVRKVAEAKFSATARAEDVAGVKCDCVLRVGDGSVIVIEVTKEHSIEKLRGDLNKFNTIRPYFFAQNLFPRCYFIMLADPTPALIAGGEAAQVKVLSVTQFVNSMSGFADYSMLRSQLPFGSAVDLYSGQPDETSYVKVDYTSNAGDNFSPERIADELLRGRAIILIGDYGSGKSRCVKEVFGRINESYTKHYQSPIAINLRDNWGLKRAAEILTRHFTDLGLADRIPEIMKAASHSGVIYLLDGFDEIGAQTWSDDPTKLVSIRKQSLVGVKDLIEKAQSGVLITGREHYFNNDVELLECLGLTNRSVLILRCQEQLNDSQFAQLIGSPFGTLPLWMPKKPLIGVVIRGIDTSNLKRLFETSTGQADFWDLLLQTFCEREAKINPILDAEIIRTLYSFIGRLSRMTATSLGPISIKQINEAFEETTGRPPTDESAIILQRLPGLSRIGAESLDRQFVDAFILDGLKAEDLLALYLEANDKILQAEWKHPIENFGASFVAARLTDMNQEPGMLAFVKRNWHGNNRVMLADMLASLFLCDRTISNFSGMSFKGGRFSYTSFGDAAISNLILDECLFDEIDITDAQPQGIVVTKSIIMRASGVANKENLPAWMQDCEIEEFQSVNTLAEIRAAGLSKAETFLLSTLRKLFLQPGSGRKHSSLFKGYGDSSSKKICEKVIALLVREGFCDRIQGATEDLYIPDRSLTARARAITNQLTQSKDPIWQKCKRFV